MAKRILSPVRSKVSKKTQKTKTVRKPSAAEQNSALARLVHRLEIAGSKLDIVSERWAASDDIEETALGAVPITRDVARELGQLYCDLLDWSNEAGFLRDATYGDLVESFARSECQRNCRACRSSDTVRSVPSSVPSLTIDKRIGNVGRSLICIRRRSFRPLK
jgi:hypothetical protein